MSVLKAIRGKCLDCMGGSAQEVKLCPVDGCTLHPYRLGKNPFRKRELTDEQREAIGARLNAARNKNKEAPGGQPGGKGENK